MGNDQSRTSGSGGDVPAGPIDYYELLQIDEEATYDEIKVSGERVGELSGLEVEWQSGRVVEWSRCRLAHESSC
jgi:hypothetical protein